jgi:hypothetical protein
MMQSRGVENPSLIAADTAGIVSLLGPGPGGGVVCPSLAAKKRRAVSD